MGGRNTIAGLLDQNVELARLAGDTVNDLITLATYFGGPERDSRDYPPEVRAIIDKAFAWMVQRAAMHKTSVAQRRTRRPDPLSR